MAPENKTTGWLKGRVIAVPSGDSLVIMGNTKSGLPPEKTITHSSLIAPRLARRGGVDEPFAWDSREYLKNLCIGKDVTFKVEYTVSSIGREFGSMFIGDTMSVAFMVVENGWAKVRKQDQSKSDASPLLRATGEARRPGASESSIRDLPPSPLGNADNFNAMGLLESNKGKPLHALVEQGVAKYMEWSASMLEAGAKLRLMSADIQSKKTRLGMFTNYVPPKLDSKAIENQNFTGKVVEVVSAYCFIVADDSIPFGSPLAERRVNLSGFPSSLRS